MSGPALTLEILYAAPTVPDYDAVAERVACRHEGGGMLVHEQFARVIADGTRVPLVTHLTPSDQPRLIEREHDFGQTWAWPEAREHVARATACVAVVEMMGHLFDPADRLAAFSRVLEAVVDTTEPLALWSPNISKFAPPADAAGLEPFVNVRLFRVENGRDGEMVMDSLGLHAFGLPDVQCHFRGIEPAEMAPVLYNTAAYVLERGDVIEDGNTVPGPNGDEQWRCRHTAALIGPGREVLDVDPGAPHGAGAREAPKRGGFFERRR